MNKKQIKSAINKAAYEFLGSLGYQADDNGSTVTFSGPERKDAYDIIDWHRSDHSVCVLPQFCSPQTLKDAELLEAHMQPIIERLTASQN